MNEFILVEFIAEGHNRHTLIEKLENLEKDNHFMKIHEGYSITDEWYTITGRIDSMYASIIKLRDPFLAERMRVSYIPEELKSIYRS